MWVESRQHVSICTLAWEYNANPRTWSVWLIGSERRFVAVHLPLSWLTRFPVSGEWADPCRGERGQRRNFNLPLQTHRAHRVSQTWKPRDSVYEEACHIRNFSLHLIIIIAQIKRTSTCMVYLTSSRFLMDYIYHKNFLTLNENFTRSFS